MDSWQHRNVIENQPAATVSAAAFPVLENVKMEVRKNDGLLTYIVIHFIRYVHYKPVNTLKYY